MNPFDDKSPAELLAMVPSLSDPKLDALCAKYCDGWYWETLKRGVSGYQETWCINPEGETREATPSYCSDPSEAMRLLVKYRITVVEMRDVDDEHCGWWARAHGVFHTGEISNPCRAIAEAAATCELTRMIEGDGDAND